MKILVALDGKKYSRNIVKDVARLAENTLADIVFFGVQGKGADARQGLQEVLQAYQEDVYSYFSEDELPYGDFAGKSWMDGAAGGCSMSAKGVKTFTLSIGTGGIAKQVVQAAGELECDLVILGGDDEFGCEWAGEMNVPLRIAEDAPCSVLVIKKSGNASQIVSILDQSVVRQDALEMVNQLVTLHEADLRIVGVKEKSESQNEGVEQRMVELLKYYNERKVNGWVTLIDSEKVKKYVTSSSAESIVALWMGDKKSLIKRLFSRSMVDKLLVTSRSSVLVLR